MTETAPPASQQQTSVRTFLIADVRGYTRFTAEQGDDAAARLAGVFAQIAKEIAAAHEGEVIELRGDEALAVFASPRHALHAAVALQARFREQRADDPSLPLNVGIGLDAGEAIPVEGGYRGGALNLAARLCSLAGGGEVFASDGVVHLARKTNGLAFVDRGEVTLKGLPAPVRVIQIAPEGELPAELPPLQPILVTHPNNLPAEPTPFIGREDEIARVAALLRDPHIRLVTLTGPGGTGKTRLALQVGNTLLHDFRDGAFFVNLAPLADAALVPSSIAGVLGVQEEAGSDLLTSLIAALQTKHLLLVLDNLEHLPDAAPAIASLLERCRELHVLATSRVPLHLSWEHVHAVPPLSLPDPHHLPDLASLAQYDAVALFIDRARAAKDSFTVTNDNAPAVAEICTRLDGLPLAIELAAARITLFPPQTLLQRLSSRLKLLTGGARDLPARQQTLRGTIDWSYSLLSPDEQILFARLSVFAGGCSFEAAEIICNPDGDLDLLEGMASLVDKSLLRQEGEEEPRFVMLETIREYAEDKLQEEGDAALSREGHARFFVALAETAEPGLVGRDQVAWLRRLDADQDNLRAALSYFEERGDERFLALVGALSRYWSIRGYWAEGRRWLDTAVSAGKSHGQQGTALLAKVMTHAGALALLQGQYEEARALLEDSRQLSRRINDGRGIAEAVFRLGNLADLVGRYEDARSSYEESLRHQREIGDTRGVAMCLHALGLTAYFARHLGEARSRWEESLRLARELGETRGVATDLAALGGLARHEGRYAEAQELLDQSLQLFREVGDTQGMARSLMMLGYVVVEQGRCDEARALDAEGLRLSREIGDARGVVFALDLFGVIAGSMQQHERSTILIFAVRRLLTSMGAAPEPGDQDRTDRVLAAAEAALGLNAYQAFRERGEAMSLEEAVTYALGENA